MRSFTLTLLAVTFSTAALAQGTLPNPFYRNTMSPWVGNPTANWAPDNFSKNSVVIPPGNKLVVSTTPPFNQFFGEGVNIIMMTLSGVRDAVAGDVSFKIAGDFFVNKPGSSFSRDCAVPTEKKLVNLKGNPYGVAKAFAWAVPVNPGGNGTGTFSIEATDGVGIVARSAESFFLCPGQQAVCSTQKGIAAGYRLTGVAPGGTWDLKQVTSKLNDLSAQAPGYQPAGILNVGALAPAGFSKITFQAKAQTANSKVQVHVWNWGSGCGAGSWVALPEASSSNPQINRGISVGTTFGSTISITLTNPNRFVDQGTGAVLVMFNLAPSLSFSGGSQGSPNDFSIRAFRLQ